MVIDPKLYEKVSGRSADPSRLMGETLARSAKAQSERDALPKGFSGGWRVARIPGVFAQVWHVWRLWRRDKG